MVVVVGLVVVGSVVVGAVVAVGSCSAVVRVGVSDDKQRLLDHMSSPLDLRPPKYMTGHH